MNKSHAEEKGNDSDDHDAIFGEDPLRPDISSANSEEYNGDCIDSTPPGDKQCWLVVSKSVELWSLTQETSK